MRCVYMNKVKYDLELERTYAFAEKLGTIVFCSKVLRLDKNGKPIRAPLAELVNRKHVKKSVFFMGEGQDEYIPTIHLGAVGAKQFLCCVDIDIKHGRDGSVALNAMFPEIMDSKTIIERTGSGGYHYYFLAPERLITKSNGTSGMLGVDLLCENVTKNPSLCFVPPAYGSALDGRRHEWITDPCTTEIAPLPESLLKYWRGLSATEKKEKKTETEGATTLDAVDLFKTTLPNAIRRNTADGQAIDVESQAKLDEFLDLVATGSKWASGCCRAAWVQLGLVMKKLDCPEEERFELFNIISSLMPDYDGVEGCLLAWKGFKKPRAGGYTLNRWKGSRLIKEELAREINAKIGDMNFFENIIADEAKKKQEEHAKYDKELDEVVSTIDREIAAINEKLLLMIAKGKEHNCFFRLADATNRLFENGEHPMASLLFAVSVFSATFQYEYAFKAMNNLGYAAPNTFVGIFASSGVGKQVLFDIYKKLVLSIGITQLADAKSTIGLFRQISGQPVPRDFLMLLDEMKSDGGFFLKPGKLSGAMDATLKKAHTKLYDGTLVGWVSKTENEMEIQNVFETLFFATSFSEFADDYIQCIDFEQGIGNRPLYYIAPKKEDNANVAGGEAEPDYNEYFNINAEGVDTFESIIDKFIADDVEQINAVRSKFSREMGRKAFYEAKYPKAVTDEGSPLFEAYEVEQVMEGLKKAEDKKKHEIALKKAINATDVYEPTKMHLDPKNFKESVKLLSDLKKGQTADDSTTRKRLHGIKIATLIELGEDKYYKSKTTPATVSYESVKDAHAIVCSCFDLWLRSSEKHTAAREDVTFNDIKETKLLARVRKKLMNKINQKGSAQWSDMKALLGRDKEVKHKDNFFQYVVEHLSTEFVVKVGDDGVERIVRR